MLTHGSYTNNEIVTSYGEYVDKIRKNLQTAHFVAHTYIEKSAKKQKDRYDTHAICQGTFFGTWLKAVDQENA